MTLASNRSSSSASLLCVAACITALCDDFFYFLNLFFSFPLCESTPEGEKKIRGDKLYAVVGNKGVERLRWKQNKIKKNAGGVEVCWRKKKARGEHYENQQQELEGGAQKRKKKVRDMTAMKRGRWKSNSTSRSQKGTRATYVARGGVPLTSYPV